MDRNEQGQFIPGAMTEEHKARISAGQVQRYMRERANAEPNVITHKKCTKCGEYKRVPEDYVMRTRKLKSGEKRKYAAGECRQCSRERTEKRKAKFIAEHGQEAWNAKQRSYRDPDKKRKYNREYWRMTYGKGRRVWKKYAHEADPQTHCLVPVSPFKWYWDNKMTEAQRGFIKTEDPDLYRALTRTMKEYSNVSLFSVDRVGILLDTPELAHVLYPEY